MDKSTVEGKKMEKDEADGAGQPFLQVVYAQSTHVYTTFVNLRFNVLFYFAGNALLFHFFYAATKDKDVLLAGFVAGVGLLFTWIIYLLDRRNAQVFKHAVETANQIENHFRVPENMQLHNLYSSDSKNKSKVSHSRIILVLTIISTLFWLVWLVWLFG